MNRASFVAAVLASTPVPICSHLTDLPSVFPLLWDETRPYRTSYSTSNWAKGTRTASAVANQTVNAFLTFGLTEMDPDMGPVEASLGIERFQSIFAPFVEIPTLRLKPAFITGSHRSVSTTHFDGYNNILVVLRGTKTLWLAPPHTVAATGSGNTTCHTPTSHPSSFRQLTAPTGTAVFIPEGWWHYVDSTPGCVAQGFWWDSKPTVQT